MEGKEKMVQIYEAMAEMTLETIKVLDEPRKKKKGYCTILDGDVLEMVRTTQSLYETINHANQTVIATISESDAFVPEDKDGKHYKSEPSVKR